MSKRKHLKRGTLVCVATHDIEHRGGWTAIDEIAKRKPIVCRFVGWVIRDDRKCLVIVSSQGVEHDAFCYTRFPRGWVRKVEILVRL